MIISQALSDKLLSALQKVSALLAQELILQGHEATGNLIRSFYEHIENTADGVTMQIWSKEDYSIFVDTGRKPGKYVPVEVLIRWVQIKGIDTKWEMTAKQAAFIINRKIYNEGIPTSGSLQYSKTGSRTNYIQSTIDKAMKDFYNDVAEALQDEFDNVVIGQLERAA